MADFNLEEAVKASEQSSNVQANAIERAKKNLEERKLAEEARKVEYRLQKAEDDADSALKDLRFNRKKEAAAKDYLTAVTAAKDKFEKDGNCDAYDKAVDAAENKRDEAIREAKRAIFGTSW